MNKMKLGGLVKIIANRSGHNISIGSIRKVIALKTGSGLPVVNYHPGNVSHTVWLGSYDYEMLNVEDDYDLV